MLIFSNDSFAAYGTVPKSNVDPSIVNIDEDKFLGVTVEGNYVVQSANGDEKFLSDYMGKPLLLVFAYFRCDGACSSISKALSLTLKKVNNWVLGEDYRILTVSFDHQDTPQTLSEFLEHMGFSDGLPAGWDMVTMKSQEEVQRLTSSLGYKFFWEPRDRVFLHPSVYIMLSPKGRVTRYLYATSTDATDLEVSITKAFGSEISSSNIINFIVGSCFSYNYEDGKYTLNYPIFVALAALILGVILLSGGGLIMIKRRVRT